MFVRGLRCSASMRYPLKIFLFAEEDMVVTGFVSPRFQCNVGLRIELSSILLFYRLFHFRSQICFTCKKNKKLCKKTVFRLGLSEVHL